MFIFRIPILYPSGTFDFVNSEYLYALFFLVVSTVSYNCSKTRNPLLFTVYINMLLSRTYSLFKLSVYGTIPLQFMISQLFNHFDHMEVFGKVNFIVKYLYLVLFFENFEPLHLYKAKLLFIVTQ